MTYTFPEKWKTADVVPIPKTPPPHIDNLRPISKLPVCSKVFEKFILDSVKERIIRKCGDDQFGFRPKISTLHAHIAIQEYVTSKLDNPETKDILLISFDMSKAFDKLDHRSIMGLSTAVIYLKTLSTGAEVT